MLLYFLPPPRSPPAGHKRRLGLLGAKRTTITVHRSEEILPRDVVAAAGGATSHLVRQGTSVSSGEDGGGGGNASGDGDFGEGSERYSSDDNSFPRSQNDRKGGKEAAAGGGCVKGERVSSCSRATSIFTFASSPTVVPFFLPALE